VALQAGAPSAQTTPPAAQDGFVTVAPGELGQEQLPAAPLVFAAYAFVWLALVTYVFLLWRRLVRVEHDLHDVSERLRKRSP
jgi:CcmD family protein